MMKQVAKFKLSCIVDTNDKASVMFIRSLLKRGLGTMLRCKPQGLRAVFLDEVKLESKPKSIVYIREQHFSKPNEEVGSNERSHNEGGGKMQRLQISNAANGIILALPMVTSKAYGNDRGDAAKGE